MRYQAHELITFFLREDEREDFLKELEIQREHRSISARQFLFTEWEVENIETMLMSAFVFADSLKGSNYWWSIVNRAIQERDSVTNMLLIDREKFTAKYANEGREEERL